MQVARNIKSKAALPKNITSIMLSAKEKAFIEYWEQNRLKEKSILKQFFPGLPIGLTIGAAILFLLDSGWYERANMVASSEGSPAVIFIAIAGIVAFTGFFYKKFRWEMNEQAYKELKLRNEMPEKNAEPNAANN
jgi:hypothetical protein